MSDDMALRRANVLAKLDLERQRAAEVRPHDELDRRLERIEAAMYVLAACIQEAIYDADLAVELADSGRSEAA